MCRACYAEHFDGREPPTVTETMRRCAVQIRSLMDREPTAGGLHVVVDDWNLEDNLIAWCQDRGLSDEESAIAACLMTLTTDERYAVMDVAERESGATPSGKTPPPPAGR